MNVPDLSSMLVSLSEVFPLIVRLVFVLIGVIGLWIGSMGLYTLYNVATDEYKFSNRPVTMDSAFGKIALGGAMIVAPVMLWRFANTFVLGGDVTYSMFNYSVSSSTNYCSKIQVAVTYFFMALGAVAWLFGSLQLYDATNNQSRRAGSATLYFVGGVLCFFVNDVAKLVSATIGMDVTFSNVCTIMG